MIEFTLIQKICIWTLPVIFALTLHEVAHGWAALCFGDHTARLAGRLSLNPLRHIDWLGTVIVPLLLLSFTGFVLGWAKPVPIDERYFAMRRRQLALACVALVGPLANVLMAVLWGAIAKTGDVLMTQHAAVGTPLLYMGQAGMVINSILAILNLLPVPPLDGAKALACVLPARAAYYFNLIEPYGMIILILLLLSGILVNLIQPLIAWLFYGISALFSLN